MINTILHRKAEAPCLALRIREAAKAIGVSERTLWDWTKNSDVPHFRRGKTLLYPTAALARWLDEQAEANKAADVSRQEGGDHDPR